MKKIFLIFTFAAAFLTLAADVSAQKTKATTVTSTIENADSNLLPFRIESDNLGSYKNGVNSVVSQIQAIGDWELDMLASPVRRTFIDFSDAVPGNDPNKSAPFSGAYVPVRFHSALTLPVRN